MFLHRIAGFPAFAFGVSAAAKIIFTLLLFALVFSIGFLIILIKNWLSGKMKTTRKLLYSVVVLSFVGAAIWLHYWKLIGYRF